MELEEYSARIGEFGRQLQELLSSNALTIHDLIKGPSRFNIEGVYIISTPDDSEMVYAGKTRTKSIIDRFRDHRGIDTSSDLKGMLRLNPNYPQQIDEYLVRCVEVADARRRTFLEHFLISILQSPFNK